VYTFLTPSFEENPLTQRHEILSQKKLELLHVAQWQVTVKINFMILSCTVLIEQQSVTDTHEHERSDRRTDAFVIVRRALA